MNVNATAGETKYAGANLTDANNADLSTTTITMGLSQSSTTAPTTWSAPDYSDTSVIGKATVKLLVHSTQAPGTYYLWIKMIDNPETLVFPVPDQTVVVI